MYYQCLFDTTTYVDQSIIIIKYSIIFTRLINIV